MRCECKYFLIFLWLFRTGFLNFALLVLFHGVLCCVDPLIFLDFILINLSPSYWWIELIKINLSIFRNNFLFLVLISLIVPVIILSFLILITTGFVHIHVAIWLHILLDMLIKHLVNGLLHLLGNDLLLKLHPIFVISWVLAKLCLLLIRIVSYILLILSLTGWWRHAIHLLIFLIKLLWIEWFLSWSLGEWNESIFWYEWLSINI